MEKLAYIKLNRQTACPPRAAVPVNQGRGYADALSAQRVQFAFGHGGDHSCYVGRSVTAFDLVGNIDTTPFRVVITIDSHPASSFLVRLRQASAFAEATVDRPARQANPGLDA